MEFLFAEELGLVLECVDESHVNSLIASYREKSIPCFLIGNSVAAYGPDARVNSFCHTGIDDF